MFAINRDVLFCFELLPNDRISFFQFVITWWIKNVFAKYSIQKIDDRKILSTKKRQTTKCFFGWQFCCCCKDHFPKQCQKLKKLNKIVIFFPFFSSLWQWQLFIWSFCVCINNRFSFEFYNFLFSLPTIIIVIKQQQLVLSG